MGPRLPRGAGACVCVCVCVCVYVCMSLSVCARVCLYFVVSLVRMCVLSQDPSVAPVVCGLSL